VFLSSKEERERADATEEEKREESKRTKVGIEEM
jgi:hypothetical protein